ncbi:hypothetical protein DSO57_1021712 [Entomophthora muscae]|nr:hypothetical protein DSO57_1021712 [Entomophthora muscae]
MLNEHFCTTLLPAPFIFKRFVSTVIESRRASVDIPLIAVKAVYFPCGSVVLTVYINHIVCDSRSMYEFVRLWGKIAQGLVPEPLVDSRHLLATLHRPRPEDSEAAEKKFESQAPFQPLTTDMRMCTVRVHEERLKQITKEINSKLNSDWVTCEELFFCIVCRMLLRARKCDLGPYYIRTVNIRKYLDLDSSAFGNFTGVPFEDPIKMTDLLTVPLEKAIPSIKGRLLAFDKRNVAKTVQDYLSVNPAALSVKLKKIGPRAVDSNNLANHDPSQIDFDNSPACYFFSCLYINGAFTINPVYNGYHNSCIGVDELIINDLKNDKEALDLGFTVTPLRKLLLK